MTKRQKTTFIYRIMLYLAALFIVVVLWVSREDAASSVKAGGAIVGYAAIWLIPLIHVLWIFVDKLIQEKSLSKAMGSAKNMSSKWFTLLFLTPMFKTKGNK